MDRRVIAAATLFGMLVGYIFYTPIYDTEVKGTVIEELSFVKKSFKEILSTEKDGAAVAVYHNGKLVVDLWGGYAERAAHREWEHDTMTVAFSTTKAVASLVMAMLVSSGHLRYEDLVTKYWPDFGANGKENITVQQLIEHKAGLVKFDGELPLSRGNDHVYISKLIEKTRPMWTPGITGYHALTYGWLLDQITRRADPSHRGLAQIYRETVQPLMTDKDFYIGFPLELYSRVARLVQTKRTEFIKAWFTSDFFLSFAYNSIFSGSELAYASGGYPPWMTVLMEDNEMPYNNPRVLQVENAAALGVGTARGLAAAISTIMEGSLISKEVWQEISAPTEFVKDRVLYVSAYRGHGFFYDKHPTRKDAFIITHTGHGKQLVIFDPQTKISFAYLRNGLKWDANAVNPLKKMAARIISVLGSK